MTMKNRQLVLSSIKFYHKSGAYLKYSAIFYSALFIYNQIMISLKTPLLEIKGVGPKFIQRLKKLNIKTVKDLLWHFPARYEDFSEISKIVDLTVGQQATIQGVIQEIKPRKSWKRRMFIIEALVSDDTGSVKSIWFNQRFLLSILKKGRLVSLAGKVVQTKSGGICLSHPIYELITHNSKLITKHTGRLVPIYPETRGLTSKGLRYLIKPILDDLEPVDESLPYEIMEKYGILEINNALRKIHFPEEITESRLAKQRFAFEDLFYLQVLNLRERLRMARQKSHPFKINLDFVKESLAKIPFELTVSQKKSLWEILKDLEKPHPMNRLLQGDVGSGKTIVAVLAALVVAKPFDAAQGKQSAFMAPTEILANQHYATFKNFFADFSGGVGLITSSAGKVFYGDGLESEIKKPEMAKKIQAGEIKIIFGTHALIQKNVKFKDLAFVVIDEQHRFGVKQRASLLANGKSQNVKRDDRRLAMSDSQKILPHFLSMSATPIPRTLTLTIFGDLDLSIIDELPKGRKEIITKIVAPENRDKAYAFIRGQVRKGRQVFVICPRIEPSEENDSVADFSQWQKWEAKTVKEEYEKLSEKVFPDLRVGMLHGRLSAKGGSASGGKSKAEIMQDFKDGKIDVLVSTSVIEVGVDIPNAAIMMIESAERFGLAQLYQFRGRVGRGEHQSFCLLFTEFKSQNIFKRLRSLIDAKNGFELAEKDLEIRGPGEFLGESQTGIPDLAMRSLQNPEIVKEAREAAEMIMQKNPDLENYPLLKSRLDGFQKEIHLE